MPKIVLPPLSKVQIGILADPSRQKLLRCGRRMGKSFVSAIAMLDGHGPRHPESGLPMHRGALHGSKVWYVSPSFKQQKDIWETLGSWCPWTKIKRGERTLEFPGGGRISFQTASMCQRLRGVGLDGLVLDEIADCSLETYFESLRPTLSDRQGWFIGSGTPLGMGENLMYVLEAKAPKLPGWKVFHHPTSANPRIPAQELVEAELTQGKTIYRQEYLAEYVSSTEALFDADWLTEEKIFVKELPPLNQYQAMIISIDPAYTDKGDFAAIVAVGQIGQDLYVEADIERRNPQTLFDDIIPLWKKWGCCHLLFEVCMAQHVMADVLLQSKQIPLDLMLKIDHTAKKERRILRLAPWLSANRIHILDNKGGRRLVDELRAFPDRKVHDDGSDALASALIGMFGRFEE